MAMVIMALLSIQDGHGYYGTAIQSRWPWLLWHCYPIKMATVIMALLSIQDGHGYYDRTFFDFLLLLYFKSK